MIKSLLKKSYNKWVECRQRESYVAGEAKNMQNVELEDLTNHEKQEVYDLWCPIVPKKFFLYHRMLKTFSHFDARFVSDEYYYPVLLRAINPLPYAAAFEHKAYYSLYYKDIPQPRMLVSRINGGGIMVIISVLRMLSY